MSTEPHSHSHSHGLHDDSKHQSSPCVIEWIGYGPDAVDSGALNSVAEAKAKLEQFPVNWFNVEGCKDLNIFDQFRIQFNLHELAVEDCTTVHQRAKVEDYANNLFIVSRMPIGLKTSKTEQLGMFLGQGFVLCFQDEEGGDCLDSVRERIKRGQGSIRTRGADYLCYAIIDAVVDAYFPVLENIGERIDHLEDVILESSRKDISAEIHKMKREVLSLRRAVWPLRDALNTLVRDTHPFLSDPTRIYLRDCYDHVARIIDLVEMYRELTIDMMDIHLSMVNNRMNEIIKVLTVITTIFIPPTFIAGVYGMNFKTEVSPFNMPELSWYFGYPFALAAMLVTSLAILAFLRSRRWI